MARSALKRMRDIVRAELDDTLTRMEDPRKMVNQMVADMEGAFDEAVLEVSRSVAGERILERKIRERRDEAARQDTQAREAVGRGDDGAARAAIERKVALDQTIVSLESARAEARDVSARLKLQLAELKTKLDTARSRSASVAIRRAMIRREAPAGTTDLDAGAFSTFERYCQDLEREEIVADVYREVAGVSRPVDDFDRLERKQRAQVELDRLKAKIRDEAGTV